MTAWELALWWVLAAVAIAGSALCSGLEIGCYTVNRVRLDIRAEGSSPWRSAAALRHELDRPDRLLVTLLVGNNAFNYLGSIAVTALVALVATSDAMIALVNTLITAPLLFILGEALPKELFRQEADRFTYRFAAFLRAVRLILTATGIMQLLLMITRTVERAAGFKAGEAKLADARRRIATLVMEGESGGTLSASQATLVERALTFQRTLVADEMTPWTRVQTLPFEADAKHLRALFAGIPHSRAPVVDRRGRVRGVISQIDLYLRPDASVQELLSPHVSLRDELTLRDALILVRASETGLGVVERQGRPVGLVTVKDLVEPLTGELADW